MHNVSAVAFAVGFCFLVLAIAVFFGLVEPTPLFWQCAALSALALLASIAARSLRT